MKKLTVILSAVFFLTILGCQKDSSFDPEKDVLYTPQLIGVRDNGKVTLSWVKPLCPECGGCICPQMEPNHFEIYISDSDPSGFEYYSSVSSNVFELTISNLINGRPYYFVVKAVRDRQSTLSNTIMTIPASPKAEYALFSTIDIDKYFGAWSPVQSTFAYTRNYSWDNGKYGAQSVFIYSFSNDTEILVEKNSNQAEWSPNGQKIVYATENVDRLPGEPSPSHIALYDISDNTSNRLTSDQSFNFLPTWSSDGKWIAYLSDRTKSNEFNIWKVSSDNGTSVQLSSDFNDDTDLGLISDRSPRSLAWSKDGHYIAFSKLVKTGRKYTSMIHVIPAIGGNKSILVPTEWDDDAPKYSPDGQTIAFVSNRSGKNEIWTMNLQTKKFNQITASKDRWVYSNPGKIDWSSSSNKILFTGNDDAHRTLYTVDVN